MTRASFWTKHRSIVVPIWVIRTGSPRTIVYALLPAQSGGPRFALGTMCPAVSTPIAKPMINVPNKRAAFGIVTVRKSSFVSTACVFCKTTTTTIKAMTATPTIFNLLIVRFNMADSGCIKQDGTAACPPIVVEIPVRQPQLA
jgi:hypothetical protein